MDKEKRAAEKRAAQNRREDAILNRVLIWFGVSVVAELILLLLNRYYINPTTRPGEIEFMGALFHAFPTIIGISAVATVACLVWTILSHKNGKGHLLPGILTWAAGAVLAVSAVTYRFNAAGVQLLCGLVPVAAVLALVFYLYQHEFFAVTVLSAMGILGLWIIRRAGGSHKTVVYTYVVVAAVVVVLAALLCRSLQQNDGVMKLGGKQLQIFPHNVSYGMIYITCAIVAVALVAALALGSAVAYYLIFALVAWLFVMAVYYTVKLM